MMFYFVFNNKIIVYLVEFICIYLEIQKNIFLHLDHHVID